MAVGFPTKVTYANGDVFSASDINDTNGTINLINPTAKGDLFAGSAANTYTKLAVGANNTVLVADSTAATGLKWAPSGIWTKVASGSFPAAASVTFSSLSGNNFFIYAQGWSSTSAAQLAVRLNGDGGNNYVPPSGDVGSVAAASFVSASIAAGSSGYNAIFFPASSTTTGQMIISGQYGGIRNVSPAAAITSITVLVSAGAFDAGSYEVWSN